MGKPSNIKIEPIAASCVSETSELIRKSKENITKIAGTIGYPQTL